MDYVIANYSICEELVLVLCLLSLETCWKVFTVLAPIFDSSFTFSFVCCTDVLTESRFANNLKYNTILLTNRGQALGKEERYQKCLET